MRFSSPSPGSRRRPLTHPNSRPQTGGIIMTDMAVIAPSPGTPRAAVNTGARLWASSLLVAGRMVRKFVRTPQLIVFTTIQSALFLLMFWALAVAAIFGFAVGFRVTGSISEALAAFGLCLVFGFALEWVFIVIGLVGGTAQAAQSMGLMVTPLVFLSSAFVPVKSMPSGIRQFSEIQPLTPMIDAVRSLATGGGGRALLEHSTSYYVGLSLIWAAAIAVVFGLLAVLRFARH